MPLQSETNGTFLFDGGNEIGINIVLATGICFYWSAVMPLGEREKERVWETSKD